MLGRDRRFGLKQAEKRFHLSSSLSQFQQNLVAQRGVETARRSRGSRRSRGGGVLL